MPVRGGVPGFSQLRGVDMKRPPYMRHAIEWAQERYLGDCEMYRALGRLEIPEDGGGFVDGKRLRERVDIWVGKDGWNQARGQYREPVAEDLAEWWGDAEAWRRYACRPAVVLPPGEHPDDYQWRDLARAWIRPVVVDTGDTGQDVLEILALALIDAGVPGVRVQRLDGQPGMVVGEVDHV